MSKKEIYQYEKAIAMLDLMIAVADNNLVFADAVTRDEDDKWDPKKWEKLKKQARSFLSEERKKRFQEAINNANN